MPSNLKLVVNNPHKQIEEKQFFEKEELKIILDLYAKMVSEGSWKDYGLSISSKQVSFSVFRNAAENQTEEFWVNFKVWGMLPITIIFTGFQIPLINKHKMDA
jgi:intracellular septation protein A